MDTAQEVEPGRHILIIDHDPAIRKLISEKLRQAGFICASCSTSQEALEHLNRHPYEATFAELEVLGGSGVMFLNSLCAQYPDVATIFVVAEANIDAGIQALKRGADDFLVEPIELGAMVASIERAVEKKRQMAELRNHHLHLKEIADQRTKEFETVRKRIELTYDESLEILGAALDLCDTETKGHSHRVSRYSMEMGRAYGCLGEKLNHIIRGSYLHDIGKIGIPDSILRKPARLTEEENEVMQTHASIGYELLRRIAFLAPAAEIVLTHQEQYDGTGYPQGLSGEEIPLGSRFFAVADALDAMTTNRPYRRALPFSVAREEITRQSGHQFAPEAVEVFLSLPEKLWEEIRQEVEGLRDRDTPPHSLAP